MSADGKSPRARSGDCVGSLGLARRNEPSRPPEADRAAGHELKIPVQIQAGVDKAPPDDGGSRRA